MSGKIIISPHEARKCTNVFQCYRVAPCSPPSFNTPSLRSPSFSQPPCVKLTTTCSHRLHQWFITVSACLMCDDEWERSSAVHSQHNIWARFHYTNHWAVCDTSFKINDNEGSTEQTVSLLRLKDLDPERHIVPSTSNMKRICFYTHIITEYGHRSRHFYYHFTIYSYSYSHLRNYIFSFSDVKECWSHKVGNDWCNNNTTCAYLSLKH